MRRLLIWWHGSLAANSICGEFFLIVFTIYDYAPMYLRMRGLDAPTYVS